MTGIEFRGTYRIRTSQELKAMLRRKRQAKARIAATHDLFSHSKISEAINADWESGRKLFPPEYVAYFEVNPAARDLYIDAFVYAAETELGLRPLLKFGCGYTDPFESFKALYSSGIRLFNDTGRLYL